MLVVLWALIFAKCFLLEYWVLIYAVPINSAFYVWGLSLMMATVASGVYLNLTRAEQQGGVYLPKSALAWSICLGLIVLCALSGLLWDSIDLFRFPLIAALLMGCGYIAQYRFQSDKIAVYSALGWFVCAGILVVFASPLALLFFSLALILFTAAPAFMLYLRLRRKTLLAS